MQKVVLRLATDTLLAAAMLFLSAGTVSWTRAWTLLAVMLLVRSVGAAVIFRVSPSLLEERASLPLHAGQARVDQILLLGILGSGFLGLPLIAGLDVFHWHVLPLPSAPLATLGLVLFALGWGIKNLALRANAFAVTVVRVQPERTHVVVDSGPYGIVRHPFYAADPLIHVGLGLWLESYLAVICAVVPVVLMMIRLHKEEGVLRGRLPGYAAYVERVRFRLVPGVW